MEQQKECIKCGQVKDLSAYYKHKQMADGHLNKCKDCTKSESMDRYNEKMQDPEWQQKERDRNREKFYRLGHTWKKQDADSRKKTLREYKQRFPEKIAAHSATVRMKPSIEGNELHHWSYNEEHYKDVIELTVDEHNTVHRFIVYDQERKMYRTTKGILLDTKERHLNYIKPYIS